MGLLVQGLAAVMAVVILFGDWAEAAVAVDLGPAGHIEKALGPEKIPERRVAEALDQPNGPAQARSLVKGGKPVVDRAPFRVETVGHRDGFQQGGFPRTVLAGKKGDVPVERERFQPLQGRHGAQPGRRRHLVPVDPHRLDIAFLHLSASLPCKDNTRPARLSISHRFHT